MKVLSILQPWASLVVLGHKQIETRSWDTRYRGPILIHASAGKKPLARQVYYALRDKYGLELPAWDALPFGAIIGKANIEDCVPTDQMAPFWGTSVGIVTGSGNQQKEWRLSLQEKDCGDYAPNRYGWLLSDAAWFDAPIPAKGALNLWDYSGLPFGHIKTQPCI